MSNVDACKALIDSQAAKGLRKYGVPLERSDATVSQLARHGAEEMADALAYFVALETAAKALEAALAAADKALIEARDLFCHDEDDDIYWRWFNRHEDAVFKRLAQPSPLQSTTNEE